jgi:ABC-type bacteriocin/lantibiotic exporter with double-glycine peptidase domain
MTMKQSPPPGYSEGRSLAGLRAAAVSRELRWLAREMRPFWKWHLASVASIASAGLLALVDPLIMRWLIDWVFPARDVTALALAVGFMFAAFQGRVLLATLGGYCNFMAGQKFSIKLRTRVLDHLGNLSADYHEAAPVGQKVFLVCDTIQEIATLSTDFFPSILRTLVLGLCTLGAMFALNTRLAAIIVCLLPLFAMVNRRLRKNLRSTSEYVQNERASMASVLNENISSVLQAQLLQCGKRQLLQVHRALARTVRAELQRKGSEMRYTVYCSGMTCLSIVLALGYGGHLVLAGALSIGSLVAFYAYLMRLFDPLYTAVEMNSRLQRVGPSIRKIMDLFEMEPTIRDCPQSSPLAQCSSSLELRAVTFGYNPAAPLVDRLNLRIAPGERLALVGPNGAGKSTIARLIARVRDPQHGRVVIQNRDLRDITLASLRSHLAYLPQHPLLFDCSLEQNLRLASPCASKEDLDHAADLAELSRVVAKLPFGWRQPLGPGGNLLSGGERQRVAIARTLLQKPRILVLDEATSALDASAERVILERLNRLLPDTTIILITHRLSAITWVDRIVVLEGGRIVESGSHSEIYHGGGTYSHLYDNQTSFASTLV